MSAADSESDLPPEVQTWLEEHPEADAEGLKEVWSLSRDAAPTFTPDATRLSEMREALNTALETDRLQEPGEPPPASTSSANPLPDRSPRKASPWRSWGTRIAGALLLLVTVLIFYLALPTRVTAPSGDTHTAHLPDGSRVELNSATTLRYPRWWQVPLFRRWLGRRVSLEGEAFFDVRERGSSFQVETENAEIRVLGTQFNVRARRMDGRPETQVAVAKGRITVTAAGIPTQLDSAEAATVHGSAPPSRMENVALSRILAWREGGFAFRNASIHAISAEVERRFDLSIDVAPGLDARPITLHINEAQGPATLLRDVCSVAGCRLDSINDEYTIRPR